MKSTQKETLALPLRKEIAELERYRLERHAVAVKLDQNENPYGVLEPIRSEMEAIWAQLDIHRYPELDPAELKNALGRLGGWPGEGVLIGNGSNELILMLALATLEKGRTAVAPTPSFSTFGYVTRLLGAELVEIPPGEDRTHRADAFLEAVEHPGAALVFLCSPNNPTGAVMRPAEIERIADACRGLVVVDEAYFEFSGWSARELLPRHPRMVVLRTLSKAAGLAGLRMGYALTHPDLASQVQKAQLPYAVNALSRAAALAVCRQYREVQHVARRIVKERERVFSRLRSLEAVHPYPSAANFVLFDCDAGARPVFEGLLARGVLVRDLSSHPLLPRSLRVTVGRPEENDVFLKALGETLEAIR